MTVSLKKKSIIGLGLLVALLTAVAMKGRIEYTCNAEFTYVDQGLRPNNEWADEIHRKQSVVAAAGLAANLLSEKNLCMIAERCRKNVPSAGQGAPDFYDLLSRLQFTIVGTPVTNFEVRCRLSLSSKNQAHLSEILAACLESYKHFVDSEVASRVDKAVIREHIEWAKCKRRIEALERNEASLPENSTRLTAERKTLDRLATAEEDARKRILECGQPTIVDISVHCPKWHWFWK